MLRLEELEKRELPALMQPMYLAMPVAGHHTATAANSGDAPAQLRAAYGVASVMFGNVAATGAGQTIAIIDAYNDPKVFADLNTFDGAFKLTGAGKTLLAQFGAAASFLTVYNEHGQVINPGSTSVAADPTGGWEGEESLDVQWAHAFAPGAHLDLIEASSTSDNDLYTAAQTGAGLKGVSVVSMSFGGSEFADEAGSDHYFTTPAGHTGVTFLASTGDNSAGEYPAFSPNVIAVGGTTLQLSGNTVQGETAWSTGSDSWNAQNGTGGGTSQYESEPAYQDGVQGTGQRTTPDVALEADPATGVAIYDSYKSGGWQQIGGTSLAAPSWAGLFAVADQGRHLAGLPTFNSGGNPVQALQALYSLPTRDFHDITRGSISANGATYTAGVGYDEVTGLGSPVANPLLLDLAAYGAVANDRLAIATQPPGSVAAGSPFTLVIDVVNAQGNVDTAFNGSLTVRLANDPGGSTLGGTLTVQAVNGVATFTDLTLDTAGTGYTLEVTGSGLASVTTSAITVTAAAAPGNAGAAFVLLANGQLWEYQGGSGTLLSSGIARISNPGVDANGNTVVDVVTTGGVGYEYHDGQGWVRLGSGVRSAVADNGVSYVLFTNGTLDEYAQASGTWSYLAASVVAISAGTDAQGGNAVAVLQANGNAYEYSDSNGWFTLANGVRSLSAGPDGQTVYVTTAGNAYLYSQLTGSSTYLASSVAQVAAGTDASGAMRIDLLDSNGTLWQDNGTGWQALAQNVAALAKAQAGVLDAVFADGAAEQLADGTWTKVAGGAVTLV